MKQSASGFLIAALLGGVTSHAHGANGPTAPHSAPEVLQDRSTEDWPEDRVAHPSNWNEQRKASFRVLFDRQHFDVLVVPFQVVDYGFSRSTRSLMTAKLAYAMTEAGVNIPDPYLVAEALGDGQRTFQPREVFGLAQSVGASRVVQGYVGHDRHGVMRVVMRVTTAPDAGWRMYTQGPVKEHVLSGVAFSDEHPAIEMFDSLLARIVEPLGATHDVGRRFAVSPHVNDFPPSPMPDSVLPLDPAREATYLQLLATIAPSSADRVQERLFEKSLLAIDHMSPDSPDYRSLKARAYMHLDLRPAALAILQHPVGDAELEIVAALNGNVADLVRPMTMSSAERVFTAADINLLRHHYGLFDAAVAQSDAEQLIIPDPWRYSISRRLVDWDFWRSPDYEASKAALDHYFPVPGFSLAEIQQGALTLGKHDPSDFAVELAIDRHAKRFRAQNPALLCCEPFSYRASRGDFLDVLEASGVANLDAQTVKLTFLQGLPQRTLQLLDVADRVYHGQPRLTLARVEALAKLSTSASPESQGALQTQAVDLAADVVLWEGGQTGTSGMALVHCWRTLNGALIPNPYMWDLPYHDGYTLNQHMGRDDDGLMTRDQQLALRLAYTTFDFSVLREMVVPLRRLRRDAEADKLEKAAESRFRGSPERYEWLAASSVEAGHPELAEQRWREGIVAIPDYWDFYPLLAASMLQRGAYDEAAAVYETYPPFKQRVARPVKLSNEAYNAAWPFYWRGDFAHAKPLFELSAGLNTGSEASITSAIYLSLMQGDYLAAAAGSRERANRYSSTYGYRDYLGLLLILGHAPEASQAFELLAPQQTDTQIWDAELAGHRLSHMTDSEIIAWANQDHIRNLGGIYKYAPWYLLRAGITDRVPSPEIVDAIAALEGRYAFSKEFYETATGPTYYLGGPIAIAHPANPSRGGATIEMKGPSLLIAEAFRAFHAGDFGETFKLLDDAARFHQATMTMSFMQPYYAFAAAKVGKGDEVLAQLSAQFQSATGNYDYLLARAVFAALKGDQKSALGDLEHAFNVRPFTEGRAMYTEYQFADICELLWKEMHVAAYRNLALEWAKKYQVLQPWSAWAYTSEAALTTDAAARAKALKFAMYLDPGSRRLMAIPEKLRAQAEREATTKNPFDTGTAKSNAGTTPL